MQLIALATLAIVSASIISYGAPEQRTLSAHDKLSSLSWLSGHWKGDDYETFYTSPEGGIILSLSKAFSEGKVVFTEYEKIHIKGNDVLLTPHIEGQKKVSFTLTGYNPEVKKARFVNKKHDFPREISFDLTSPDNLVINLSGVEGGKEQSMQMNLQRAR